MARLPELIDLDLAIAVAAFNASMRGTIAARRNVRPQAYAGGSRPASLSPHPEERGARLEG
jgi:hypothetical protein